MDEPEPAWSYEPDRTEATLHIVGWTLVVIFVGMMVPSIFGNNAAFDLANVPGFGFVASLGAMEVLARRRAGVSWGGWSAAALRRTWKINSYALRPWKVPHSLAILRAR